MATGMQRIAINGGGSYGAERGDDRCCARRGQAGLGVVGIGDGYDWLLVCDNDPDGGLINLTSQIVETRWCWRQHHRRRGSQ